MVMSARSEEEQSRGVTDTKSRSCALGRWALSVIFHGLVAVELYMFFFHRRSDSLGNGRKWMKLHVRRPGCSQGMCKDYVEGIFGQFDDIFCGLAAVNVNALFRAAQHL